MSIPDSKYFNSFNLMPHMGPLKFHMLLNRFPSLCEAWNANFRELESAGLQKEAVEKIIELRKNISPDREMEKLLAEKICVITINDETYPKQLKEISSAPALVYVRGEFKNDDACIAIVGSRKISPYGIQVAGHLACELAKNGITVVSGMALGTDAVAHKECLKLKKRTIAVLGGGIDNQSIYPVTNRMIADEIASSGALVSEYPIGTPPLKQHFPARNRIISGLSKGVLVIEAAESSGALITAKFALEQNREIFAIPGNIFSINSIGTNNLIKLGAKLVTKVDDILEEINFKYIKKNSAAKVIVPDNDEEALILKNLTADAPIHVDQLAKNAKMNISALTSLLTLMEIKGKVKNIGGMKYIIAN